MQQHVRPKQGCARSRSSLLDPPVWGQAGAGALLLVQGAGQVAQSRPVPGGASGMAWTHLHPASVRLWWGRALASGGLQTRRTTG